MRCNIFVLLAGFLLTGAGGGGFLYAITKEAKFSEKVPELIKGLGVSLLPWVQI